MSIDSAPHNDEDVTSQGHLDRGSDVSEGRMLQVRARVFYDARTLIYMLILLKLKSGTNH